MGREAAPIKRCSKQKANFGHRRRLQQGVLLSVATSTKPATQGRKFETKTSMVKFDFAAKQKKDMVGVLTPVESYPVCGDGCLVSGSESSARSF